MTSHREKPIKLRIENNPKLTRNQMFEIAQLHHESIPWSLNSSLGVEHLYSLYSFYMRQSNFQYIVAFSEENKIIGLCSFLTSESTLNLYNILNLFYIYGRMTYLVKFKEVYRSLRMQLLLRHLRRNLPQSAHITTFFVHRSHRGKRIAQQLLLETEKWTLQEGIFLLTVDVDVKAENALNWYEQVKFQTCFLGGDFLLLQKEISKPS